MRYEKPIRQLTPAERDAKIAREAIEGLYNEVVSEAGPFGSLAKAAKAIGVHPNVLARAFKDRSKMTDAEAKEGYRRMSAWAFVSLCRALGYHEIATTSEVEVLYQAKNLTLEGFLALRRISGNVSDCIEIMSRQG